MDACVLAVLMLLMVIGRWDIVLSPKLINVDEFQAGANALRIIKDGYSWNSVDGYTTGPFHSLVLAWPALIGKEVTIQSVRFTAFFMVYGLLALIYLSVKRFSASVVSFCIVLPLAVFYGYTRTTDFIHYSSELLPVILLTPVFVLVLSCLSCCDQKNIGYRGLVFVGLALGVTPFAKLQAAPLAVILFFMTFCFVIKRIGIKSSQILVLLAATVIPSLLLVTPLIVSQSIPDFYISYVEYSKGYVAQALDLGHFLELIKRDLLLKHAIALLVEILMCSLLLMVRLGKFGSNNLLILVCCLAVIYVAQFSIRLPGRMYPHYLNFLVPFLAVMAGFFSSCWAGEYRSVFLGFFSLLVVGHLAYAGTRSNFDEDAYLSDLSYYHTPNMYDFSLVSPRVLDWIPGGNDRMLIWGWRPQWYLLSGITPASRESETERQMWPTNLVGYYRDRMRNDLDASRPDMVLDATLRVKREFPERDKYGVGSFSDLEKILRDNYVELGHGSRGDVNDCPNIYLEKSRFDRYQREVIPVVGIDGQSKDFAANPGMFSVDHINDNSVTEDACVDFWLAPESINPTLLIRFEKQEPVRSVKILNTHNGYQYGGGVVDKVLDRESKEVSIALYKDKQMVYQKSASLKSYPNWTEVVLNDPVQADSAVMEVLSYKGPGAGLNEIKFYRN